MLPFVKIVVTRQTRGQRIGDGLMEIFGDAVASGAVDPHQFTYLWVQSGSAMSGGSGNQLELPRLASRFFIYGQVAYDDSQRTLAVLSLHARGQRWGDRKLTWHGNNRMERLNLPTQSQGGFSDYSSSLILFVRQGSGEFGLEVAPEGSIRADEIRQASGILGAIYKLGNQLSDRTCGLY